MRNLSFWSDKLYTNAEIRIFFSCPAKKNSPANQPTLSTTHILSYFFRQQILKGEQSKRGKETRPKMKLSFHGIHSSHLSAANTAPLPRKSKQD